MKQLTLVAAALLAGSLCAALTQADLTPEAIAPAIAAQPEAQRQAYAREVLQAIAASPSDDAAKTQALTSASRALISGAGKAQGVAVIAEIFNTVPIAQLQGVADLLAEVNFGQAVNGFTDAQYDDFCAKVVGSAARYIEASGTDSPAVRMSILAATFAKASADPDRTRPKLIAALPASVQTAAATYMHRNTVINKVNKIMELLDLDLEDGNLRQRLILSCQFIRYYENVMNREFRP